MQKLCDKCGKNPAQVSYDETVNGKTRHLDLCKSCANKILAKNEMFLNSFFKLDPFKKFDTMFETFMPKIAAKKPTSQKSIPNIKINQTTSKLLENPREQRLRELKKAIDALKKEEGIAVMLQDYLKAAEIKKQREKLQKDAEKIAFN